MRILVLLSVLLVGQSSADTDRKRKQSVAAALPAAVSSKRSRSPDDVSAIDKSSVESDTSRYDFDRVISSPFLDPSECSAQGHVSPIMVLCQLLAERPFMENTTMIRYITRVYPDLKVNSERLRFMRRRLLLPTVVPLWFHDTILRFPAKDRLVFIPDSPLLRDLAAIVHLYGFEDYSNIEVLKFVASSWIRYCVNPLELNPAFAPCVKTEVIKNLRDESEVVFALSPYARADYLRDIAESEHKRLIDSCNP